MECPICREETEDIFVSPCPNNHSFHQKCFDEWIQISSTCPTCRFVIKSCVTFEKFERLVEEFLETEDPFPQYFIDYLNEVPEDWIVKTKYKTEIFKCLKNPSEAVQIAAVTQNGYAIRYIQNPSEEVQLAAVKENGYVIQLIENPSEAVQIAAVTKYGIAIQDIKNPSEAVQIAATKQR